jgi:hypothetical protein
MGEWTLVLDYARPRARFQGWKADLQAAPTARRDLAAGFDSTTGILYAVGGSGNGGPGIASLEAYDTNTDSWTTKAPMPTARGELGAAFDTANGILYAVGGCDSHVVHTECFRLQTVEAYDTKTDSWTARAPMPTTRQMVDGRGVDVAVFDATNQMMYVAGRGAEALEAYDTNTNSWTTRSGGGWAEGITAATFDNTNGIMYACAGQNLVAYDPDTDSWTFKGKAPTLRDEFALGFDETNGIAYFVGGRGTDTTYESTIYQPQHNSMVRNEWSQSYNYHGSSIVEAYDVNTGFWATKDPMPTARKRFAVVFDNTHGILYAVGGRSPTQEDCGAVCCEHRVPACVSGVNVSKHEGEPFRPNQGYTDRLEAYYPPNAECIATTADACKTPAEGMADGSVQLTTHWLPDAGGQMTSAMKFSVGGPSLGSPESTFAATWTIRVPEAQSQAGPGWTMPRTVETVRGRRQLQLAAATAYQLAIVCQDAADPFYNEPQFQMYGRTNSREAWAALPATRDVGTGVIQGDSIAFRRDFKFPSQVQVNDVLLVNDGAPSDAMLESLLDPFYLCDLYTCGVGVLKAFTVPPTLGNDDPTCCDRLCGSNAVGADWICTSGRLTDAAAAGSVPGYDDTACCEVFCTGNTAYRCDGADWAGTEAECLESAGTCAGADPAIVGATSKALCDAAATTAGSFTSAASLGLGRIVALHHCSSTIYHIC